MIETEVQVAGAVRVPALAEGRALIVTRYDKEQAVVVNPQDFRRLAALDAALHALGAADALSPTSLVLEAHRLDDEPEDPVEDPATIRSLLGLAPAAARGGA